MTIDHAHQGQRSQIVLTSCCRRPALLPSGHHAVLGSRKTVMAVFWIMAMWCCIGCFPHSRSSGAHHGVARLTYAVPQRLFVPDGNTTYSIHIDGGLSPFLGHPHRNRPSSPDFHDEFRIPGLTLVPYQDADIKIQMRIQPVTDEGQYHSLQTSRQSNIGSRYERIVWYDRVVSQQGTITVTDKDGDTLYHEAIDLSFCMRFGRTYEFILPEYRASFGRLAIAATPPGNISKRQFVRLRLDHDGYYTSRAALDAHMLPWTHDMDNMRSGVTFEYMLWRLELLIERFRPIERQVVVSNIFPEATQARRFRAMIRRRDVAAMAAELERIRAVLAAPPQMDGDHPMQLVSVRVNKYKAAGILSALLGDEDSARTYFQQMIETNYAHRGFSPHALPRARTSSRQFQAWSYYMPYDMRDALEFFAEVRQYASFQ